MLTWNVSSGATSYVVSRSTTNGGPYTVVSTIQQGSITNITDASLTNGTTYYYVVAAANSYGTSANTAQVSATPSAPVPPPVPTGLAATPGNGSVALTWTASSGATSYKVSRSTTSGSGYAQIVTPASASYTDSTVTNGTTYYYVVAAVGSGGTSANSTQVSATPAAPTTAVNVTIDTMTGRHAISPYVYGGAFPKDAATITDSGLTVVRWGGNAASTYNWKLFTDNADNDFFFEDFTFGALNNSADSDSTQFIKDVQAAGAGNPFGSNPLTTMVMLPWVAQSPEQSLQQGNGSNNYHWTFSVSQDNACSSSAKTDQFNRDAGVNLKSDCSTTMVASNAQINRAYFPLLDGPPQGGDPANSVYRNQWAAALGSAFGNTATCPIPYSAISSCHFYDMDNEIDIWGGTHVDIHPNPATYNELRDTYLLEARNLKGWDPASVRLGPVSCCWFFYWRSATGSSETSNHGGVDFLPWWLNEVAWSDAIAGSRSLDIFDIHAYPDGPDTSSFTQAQKQALAVRLYRDWWDPTYTSEATYIQNGGFSIEPIDSKPFRIPRMRALVNEIYPGTQFSITEWSAASAGEADFSTALGDADAYGVLGRERVGLSTRWTAPDPSHPNYQALKLYTNYDGGHHGFDPISVSATHNADPNLFSVYAGTSTAGNSMTVMVLNKDPNNAAKVTFAFNAFNPSSVATYTLSQASPNSIVAATPAWSSTMTFQPYTATLLVISGSSTPPASEWDLNPDAIMAPANGTATLSPQLTSGSTAVTVNNPVFDAFEGAPACGGASGSATNPTVASGTPGSITLNAPASPGFCHFSVTASDGTTKGGWLVVGNPAATLAITGGNNQTGTHGTALPVNLSVTLSPGSSGGTATGASVLFTANAGSLTNVASGNGEKIFTGTKVIAVTNSSGIASVTLTLPASAGAVTVHAEGPYGLGHPVVPADFSETAN